jgi:hypothetical protein
MDLSLLMSETDELDDGVSVRDLLLVNVEFLKNCICFLRYCTKASMFGMISFLIYLNEMEFTTACWVIFTGLLIFGFLGYIIQLIHSPLNRILMDV